MKKQNIFCILLLLLTLLICTGCGSTQIADQSSSPADMPAETSLEGSSPRAAAGSEETEDIVEDSFDMNDSMETELSEDIVSAQEINLENVTGIFEGLEDNHTALFSFDGVEITFYFDLEIVKDVLYDAILGSPYVLSYDYNQEMGLYEIYEISET